MKYNSIHVYKYTYIQVYAEVLHIMYGLVATVMVDSFQTAGKQTWSIRLMS